MNIWGTAVLGIVVGVPVALGGAGSVGASGQLVIPVDVDGDGWSDLDAADLDADGRLDAFHLDQDRNGVYEQVWYDTNGDGYFDLRASDWDQDGLLDVIEIDVDADGQFDLADYPTRPGAAAGAAASNGIAVVGGPALVPLADFDFDGDGALDLFDSNAVDPSIS